MALLNSDKNVRISDSFVWNDTYDQNVRISLGIKEAWAKGS